MDVKDESYKMWEAAGKPEGMDEFFWKLAQKKAQGISKAEEDKIEYALDLIFLSGLTWKDHALKNLYISVGIQPS
jgi:hypothetical protein